MPTRFPKPQRAHLSAALLGALVFVATLALTVFWSLGAAVTSLERASIHKLDLYQQILSSEVKRHQFLPFALARNQQILELIGHQDDPRRVAEVNRYLEEVSRKTGAAAVYVMNVAGLTLASSNWDTAQSYIDHNYGFRPYFRAAVTGRSGHYFAVGITTSQPGLFLSYPIERGGRVMGVVALKLSLDPLEQDWATQPQEKVAVVDANGVVISSSEPRWKFRTLEPLAPEKRRELKVSRQFADLQLSPLGLQPVAWLAPYGSVYRVATLPQSPPPPKLHPLGLGFCYLASRTPLPDSDWTLYLFSAMTPVEEALANTLAFFVPTALALALVLFFLLEHRVQRRERLAFEARAKAELEASQEQLQRTLDEQEERIRERTAELRASNRLLQHEIVERTRAETVLRQAQDELVQAGKLAALGQMSAGITHELNQPLAAIRTFAASGRLLLERGQPEQAVANFGRIQELTERMATLTNQLKAFARKSGGKQAPVAVAPAVRQALALVEHLTGPRQVELELELPAEELLVLADQLRLEQVLVNLFANATDAMKAAPQRRLRIAAEADSERVRLSVADTGGGVDPQVLPHIFEPFFTTKGAGEGLGLGLSIAFGIIRDWGGALTARNDAAGACFTIDLPRCGDGKDPAP